MRKTFLILLLIVLIATTCFACSDGLSDARKSETVLSVSDQLTYSEQDWVAALAEKKSICLASDGVTSYKIVIPQQDAEELTEDANYLSDILCTMVGCTSGFEVVTDDTAIETPFLSLGNTVFAADISTDNVQDDGYVIRSKDGNIFIRSSGAVPEKTALDGVRNGIYGFAEDVLGCMFVRDDYDYIPSAPTIYLDELDITENPDFVWRRMYQYEVSQNDWNKRIRSNGTGEASGFGNDNNNYWGTWCHSVFAFVDPALYFESNPEYFALINGERRYEYKDSLTQLCLTNPDIYPIIEAKLAQWIQQNPDIRYWDFSINDNMNYCECDACESSYRKYNSRAGALIEILNKLAKRFPDVYISTLAYTFTKDVPVGIQCEQNVNIIIAPIATSQLYSCKYGDTQKSAEAKRMIEGWSKICNNLFIWDYVVDFKHLLLPFPNLAVQKDNLEFYKENNVRSVFHQGSREKKDELACLRSYLLAKQLWNIDTDINALLGKYLVVTYGDAAPYIAEYLDILHESARTEAKDVDLYDKPSDHYGDYLSNDKIDTYMQLTQNALNVTQDDPQRTEFVEEIRINVLYAKMYENSWNLAEKQEAFAEFTSLVRKHGVERPYEVAPPDMEEFLNKTYPTHLSLIKLYISLTVLGAIALVGGTIAAAIILRKKLNRSKA